MYGLVLDSVDPAFNLALEEHLFSTLTPDGPGWFILWHNAPSIIVGRHQNTVQEINQELVRRFDLPVVRRGTGGGAVYHDLGNLNFSFLRPLASGECGGRLEFSAFMEPVMETLRCLGVAAEFSSRNDLTCGGRKVSGSAQLRRPQGVLHHGTLLVDMDLDMLGAVLTGAPDKYLSKGISSLRSRVANLSELLPEGTGMKAVKDALMSNCAQRVVTLDAAAVSAAETLAASKYRTWDWNYGASPPFTELRRQRFAWGAVECRFEVKLGVITGCRIFGDFFAQKELQELEHMLCGLTYCPESLEEGLAHVDWDAFFSGCVADDMRDFFSIA